mmetsp:Transcript_38403/g.120381  ORF Transcript_38403/g.120381 Transcript_38403/m.120381 type:complete len:326 (+) Transcript_38403:516-1493(+)
MVAVSFTTNLPAVSVFPSIEMSLCTFPDTSSFSSLTTFCASAVITAPSLSFKEDTLASTSATIASFSSLKRFVKESAVTRSDASSLKSFENVSAVTKSGPSSSSPSFALPTTNVPSGPTNSSRFSGASSLASPDNFRESKLADPASSSSVTFKLVWKLTASSSTVAAANGVSSPVPVLRTNNSPFSSLASPGLLIVSEPHSTCSAFKPGTCSWNEPSAVEKVSSAVLVSDAPFLAVEVSRMGTRPPSSEVSMNFSPSTMVALRTAPLSSLAFSMVLPLNFILPTTSVASKRSAWRVSFPNSPCILRAGEPRRTPPVPKNASSDGV